jgi:hypothetical protein
MDPLVPPPFKGGRVCGLGVRLTMRGVPRGDGYACSSTSSVAASATNIPDSDNANTTSLEQWFAGENIKCSNLVSRRMKIFGAG